MEVVSLCSNVGSNVGRIKCDKKRGVPKFLLLGDAVIDAATIASGYAAVKAALIAATRVVTGESGKLFPSPEIQAVTNGTEAPTTGTLGLGYTFELRAGRPIYTFGFIMGINEEMAWQAFHNQIIPATIIDNARIAWGIETSDGGYAGADALITVVSKPFEDANTAEAILTTITVSFLSEDDFKFPAIIQTDLKAGDLEGLLNVDLDYVSHISNVWTYNLTVQNAELGKAITLPDSTLAALTASLFSAKSGVAQTTSLAITSIAVVGKQLAVTYDSTAYTALATGTPIGLYMDPPTDLATAGIVGIEGVADVTPKPA